LYIPVTYRDNETLRHHRHLLRYGHRLRMPTLSVVRCKKKLVPPVLRSRPWASAANRRRSSSRLYAFNKTSACVLRSGSSSPRYAALVKAKKATTVEHIYLICPASIPSWHARVLLLLCELRLPSSTNQQRQNLRPADPRDIVHARRSPGQSQEGY